jgi:hypothetical protein
MIAGMMRPGIGIGRAVVATIAIFLVLSPSVAQASRYALVIGSNKAGVPSWYEDKADLQFAADDAHRNKTTLELGGYKVWLLADRRRETFSFDPDAPPTTAAVVEHMDMLVRRLRAEGTSDNDVILWIDAHGDADQFFVSDGAITRAMIVERFIAPLEGLARIHLIIDACGGAGFIGEDRVLVRDASHKDLQADAEKGLRNLALTQYRHVGAITATTYAGDKAIEEQSRYRSGILSYLLRSAFANGADSNNDGAISYMEAAAFIWSATREIKGNSIRPYVHAVPPLASEQSPLIQHQAQGDAIQVQFGKRDTRMVIYDKATNQRLLEVHRGRENIDTVNTLFLPPGSPLRIEASMQDPSDQEGKRWLLDEREVDGTPRERISFVDSGNSSARGTIDADLIEGLFKRPFRNQDVADYTRNYEQARLRLKTRFVALRDVDQPWSREPPYRPPPLDKSERPSVWWQSPWFLGAAAVVTASAVVTFVGYERGWFNHHVADAPCVPGTTCL